MQAYSTLRFYNLFYLCSQRPRSVILDTRMAISVQRIVNRMPLKLPVRMVVIIIHCRKFPCTRCLKVVARQNPLHAKSRSIFLRGASLVRFYVKKLARYGGRHPSRIPMHSPSTQQFNFMEKQDGRGPRL